jgi:predicted  nucleic acid-binding Zn-ribbon protein
MSSENIQVSMSDIPTLYLGNETKVAGSNWDFGNSSVFINVSPTEPNMAVNKSYVDTIIDANDKKIDAILDGASISVENFKNFVDYVNISKRENEAELIKEIADTSSNLIVEITRATDVENGIKADLAHEIARATDVENVIRTDLAHEITRATDVENGIKGDINDLHSMIQELGKNLDTLKETTASRGEQSTQSTTEPFAQNVLTIDPKIQEEVTQLSNTVKSLEEKLDALCQYFFRANMIPK